MAAMEPSAETRAPTSQKKRRDMSKEDNDELVMLDGAFRRIKDIIPTAPYILSTPSLDPYSHYSRHEQYAWMMGHLYRPDEEHLQYRTFHYREPYQDCFVLQPDEGEEVEAERPKSQTSNSSQQAQVPKKKISLSAYKSKQANGVITPGSKKVSPSLPPSKAPIQANGVKLSDKQQSNPQKDKDVKPHKRPATEALAPEKPEKRPRESTRLSPHPRPRSDSAEAKMTVDKSAPSNSTPHGLPPLLSPVEQAVNNPYGLPDILSPTLPSNVQAELDRIEMQRKRGISDASSSSSDRKSQLLTVPDVQSQKRDEGAKGPRVRSVSVNGKSPNAPPMSSAPAAPSFVVKLKYSKRVGATITQILRLPPTRKPPAIVEKKERREETKERTAQKAPVAASIDVHPAKPKENPKITTRRPETSTPSTKPNPPAAKVAEKRPRSESDTSSNMPVKRHKPQVAHDGPTTPQPLATSPAISAKSSAQKTQGPYTTPRKEHRAVNLLRTTSAEGLDSTPGRSGTPSSAKVVDVKSTPTSAPPSGKKQHDFQLLSHVSMKLNQMGRTLKHEAQKIVGESGGKLNKDDGKRAAITTLECILSYMAAYSAQDRSNQLRARPGDVEGTWKTLLPLCISFTRFTQDIPHLDGLRLSLSAVIAAAICAQVALRASRPEAHDSPQDAAQAELAKQNNVLSKNFTLLSDHYIKLHRYTQDSRTVLPADDIRRLFPKTWAGKAAIANYSKDAEKFPGGKLSGSYFLPIQNDTTPIQAVRFGLKFLSEYIEKERIDHKIRVNLEKPE